MAFRKGKLTPKQTKFVKIITEQIATTGDYNASAAALQSYDTTPQVAASLASENLSKPNIQEAVEAALVKNGLTLDFIADKIKRIAIVEPEKVSGDTVLRANETLLKLYGAFPGSKHTNLNLNIKGKMKDLSFQEAKQELNRLNSQLGEIVTDPTEPE